MSTSTEQLGQAGKVLLERREEFLELLRSRLGESNWREHVSNLCRSLIQEQGVDRAKIDEIVEEVTPQAARAVPQHVRDELLDKIRKALEEILQ